MRKGMRWSDGTPVTSDDVKWWYENFILNTDLNAKPPGAWLAGGKVMEMEFPDPLTFRAKFSTPKPMFLFGLTRQTGMLPGHYLKQFHANLTEDKAKLEADTKAAGFDKWTAYFTDKEGWFSNPDRPSLGPWVAKNGISSERFLMERNPYFFAVDSAGNQLPYIDKINHRLFETPDVFDLWIVNGEIDFQSRHLQVGNFTLYKEAEAKGDYKVAVGVAASHIGLNPNHSSKNPLISEFFQNRNVRIALNVAMNREEINELVWNGLLKPRQYSPLPVSPQYSEKAATAYIQHDPAMANKLLDEAGYDKKDADGYRLWKDGSGPVSFIIEGIFATGSNEDDTAQLVVKYLKEVGVKASYKSLERSLYEERYNANDIDCGFWGGDRTVLPLVPEAPIFRGTMIDRPWAAGWGILQNLGADNPNASKPPDGYFITKIWDLWSQISVEPNPEKQNQLFSQIMDIWAEEVPMVTLLGEAPSLAIVKNGFRNFVEGFPNDDTTGDENVYNTETYFWDEPEKHAG
ncbi:MAG: ABC transporter substrate-binding protein [Anaerolineae bacterium]|nr:ABC transporter substrate-binding protein [Anaerolineae bacterium]